MTDYYTDPQQVNMDAMKARLADLRRQREEAKRFGFGTWILEDYARDIQAQEHAIERAKRINPTLS